MSSAIARPPLRRYVELRLGEGWATQLRNVVARPFGARSFGEFWRYWNPVHGYVLSYFVYRPLRRLLPRPAATWLTFVASGFVLHDLLGWALARETRFPELTVAFALFGAAAVAGDLAGMNLGRLPYPARAACHAGYLAASFATVHVVAERLS